MRACLAIPIFDHGETIGRVLESLEPVGLPCIVVDDGSGPETRAELERLEARHPWVEVVRCDRNRGRGAALRIAYRAAAERGMSHVVQLDADGQHAARDVPLFLAAAREAPEALVLGAPVFDASIPWHRLHGRKLSRWIVRLETRSKAVEDPLCGFRCIPLASALPLLARDPSGDRMEFDPELVIRLMRAGVPVVNVPTGVRYPEGGRSHFRMVRDNVRIARSYLRLAFERPWRSPAGAGGADAEAEWWAASERGSRFVVQLVVWGVRALGGSRLHFLLSPVALYYTLFAVRARRASAEYLRRIDRALGGTGPRPGMRSAYRHFYAFAETILDGLELWAGGYDRFDIRLHGREEIAECLAGGRGVVMVGAHLGSFDVLRVVAREAGIPVNVMMFTANARMINEAFAELDPTHAFRVIQIDPTSARAAFEIRRCVDRGESIAVLADRSRPGDVRRTARANFLGDLARFPKAPFLLAMLLGIPIVMTVALRSGPRRYDVYFERLAPGARISARDREKEVQECIEAFAARLEHYCAKAPFQWFNFFDFWPRARERR